MCHYLKYDLLNVLLIISTIVNGKKHAIFCWTQIQRSDGGRHILVWPCIPAIRYAILIAKCMRIISLYLLASNGAQQRRRRRTVVDLVSKTLIIQIFWHSHFKGFINTLKPQKFNGTGLIKICSGLMVENEVWSYVFFKKELKKHFLYSKISWYHLRIKL